jgi:hypothetical protein
MCTLYYVLLSAGLNHRPTTLSDVLHDDLFSLNAFYVEVTELKAWTHLRPPPIHPMQIPRFTRKTLTLK